MKIRIAAALVFLAVFLTPGAEARTRTKDQVNKSTASEAKPPLKVELAEAVHEATAEAKAASTIPPSGEYRVGVDDILDINVLQPDPFANTLTVSPDGALTFPFIGNVEVEGLTLIEVQQKIQDSLSEYMKYPVVSVSLRESRSRVFYVYGEVNRPGAFPLQQGMTALRAVSLAGGFTKYGSASRVRVLRQRADGAGNITLSVDLKKAMSGDAGQDMRIENGDVVTVEEGVF